jgi:uncharacterized circularly permuted ATP-grasp superfamily protein
LAGTAIDPVAAYNRLVAADPAAALEQAAALQEAFTASGITFDGHPMRSFLRPHFVARAEWQRLRDDARRLLELAARIARAAFDGDAGRLCAFLGTPEAEARWVRLDPGPPDVVLSRLDAFLGPGGGRFIEVNSDAPAGFGYGDRMAELFEQLPIFRAFARTHPVEYQASIPALVDAVLRFVPVGSRSKPTVAIVDWGEVKTRADQQILQEAFAARGARCVLADPRAMELRGGRLMAGSDPVDVVYRRAVLSELVEREDEVRDFLGGYADGAAVFVNTFRCRLSEDKAFLGLLTDEVFSSLLTTDERAFLARTVPWTRKLEERKTLREGREVDLLSYVRDHRPRLVLKPTHAYGGRDVLVGDETSAVAWDDALQAGAGKAWVVQERVAIPEEPFPAVEGGTLRFESLKVNVNPFYVAGGEAGAVARASRQSVINVSAGGGSVPTFVVG